MKLPTLKRLRNQADRLFQGKIKSLYPNCLLCGQPTQVAHHFIHKSRSSRLRYDLANGIPLCNRHHCALHAADEAKFALLISDLKGKKWKDYVLKAGREQVKVDRFFYLSAIEKLNGDK